MAKNGKKIAKELHTTAGIRWSSPTQLLIRPLPAYLWESGRDPEFSDSLPPDFASNINIMPLKHKLGSSVTLRFRQISQG
ncbi:unnamed protein product [Fusarium graminearum]|uniref:Chromosome 2, complete genome n=1 Tax=Gibberella zeae (strain ATCC MYA-4620 / CBS 123657 / FGSC 9075 / NRRL 31084 / PH-1) TaxID=229533 RepID=A0A098DI82_GIBZE|nr:unnamed protein product [Fusarium graminearum]CZS81950.1 unnamed protein product [Fusarium graminearum]